MKASTRRHIAFALGLSAVVAMSGFLLNAAPPQAIGTWGVLGNTDPSSARTGAATATLEDGTTLIAGGRMPDGTVTDSVLVYDPVSNDSTVVGQLSAPRVNAAAARLEDGRVLVVGGEIADLLSADAEIFDPSTGTSIVVANMTAPRTRLAATRLADGKVLIVGGVTLENVTLATAEVFDPETGSILEAGSMATPRAGASATLLIDNRVLVAGGHDGVNDLASAELYYPATQEFFPVDTELNLARAGHTAVLLPHNGAVLVAGGTAMNAPVTDADLFLPTMFPDPYTWSMGTFAPTAPMTHARTQAVGGPAGDDGFAFVAGGGAAEGEAFAFVTLKTDKDDYAPGEAALITGSGWHPGEKVKLVFQEDPAVHPDYTLTLTADDEGNISHDEWAPEEHDLNVRFYVMATGVTSQRRAQITFTDSRAINAASLTYNSSIVSCPAGSCTVTPLIVPAGASMTASITVNGTGNANASSWRSTGWTFSTSSTPPAAGAETGANCSNTPNHDGPPDFTAAESFPVTAPLTAGTYYAHFRAYREDPPNDCDNQTGAQVPSGPLTITSAIVVDATAPATASVTSPVNGSTHTAATVPASFSGSAADNAGGTGLNANSTTFTLQQPDSQYWTGSAWQAAVFNLATTHVATTSNTAAAWTGSVTMPSWATQPGGTYRVQAKATDKAGNTFTGSLITFTFKASQAITFNALTDKTYGDLDFAVSATASSGLTVSFSSLTTSVCTVSTATVHIVAQGLCTVRASQAGDSIFDAAPNVDRSFTVNRKAASVTPDAATKEYGAADPSFTGTLTGFLAADTVTATYARTAGETVVGSPYTISATLSPTGVLDNYTIAYNTADFTITPKAASVTPDAASKEYGSADPAFTGTLAGFLAADSVTAIYTRTGGETVTASPYTISATLDPAAVLGNYAITYNTANFSITPKAASVTPNAATKEYGSADPTFTGTLTGFLAGDIVTATYARTAGETVAGSPYTISATLAPVGVLSNYAITYNTANFTITTKAASVTPDAATKEYGTADPTFTGTLSGFLAADTVTATYTRTAGETVLGNPYTISATLDPAGVLSNYAITYNTADFTITTKAASVTPNAATKEYGGADPTFTGTLSGFLAADTVTATYTRTAGETVAGSPYTISATLDPAGVLSNYAITYHTANFTITPKAASVTPNAASKEYGAADPAFSGTLSGFLAADGVTASYARTAGETVAGNPYTISATLAPAGVLGNYVITYNTANFTITPKAASVTPNAATKEYGAADPTFTGTLIGFLAGDSVAATYARTAGETVAGSPYTISATLAPVGVLGNYVITYHTANFTITPKAASVTPNAATKEYGAADPAFSGTLSGFLAGDSVTASYARTAGETVAGSPYTISATLAPVGVLGNYVITYHTANFTITPKAASVTPNAATKEYGTADPAFSGTLSGFLAADGVTASYARTAGETVAGSPYTISATLAPAGVLGNYVITYHTANFTITPKAASVTPNAATKEYGAADPAFSGTLSGFLAADGVTASYARTAGETVAGSPYTISATLAPAGVLGNYVITYHTANFTITPKAASVTPNAATKEYGAADPAFSGTLSGFLAADGVTASYARTAGETVAGSPYTISATLAPAGVLGNYVITYHTANFTITPKAASVTPNAATKEYGAADPAFSGTLSGFLAADGVTASYARTAGETVAGSPYTISATLAPAGVLGNYVITYHTANFTITPKAASVTPNAASKEYGAADPALSGTLSGFLAGDYVTATYARTAGETVAGSPYTISATLAPAGVLGNYVITYNTANFTITTKAASVTPNAATKEYGAADPAFSGTLSGFLAADGVTASYARTAGESVAGSPYTISATLDPAGVLTNYAITYNTAEFTITAKAASVTPNAATKEYGAADPALSGTLSGFLAADSVTATYARTAGETVAGSPYIISATLDPAGVLTNYAITYNTANFTITTRAASVTPNAATKEYGAADPALSGTLSGFLAADSVTATYARIAGETVAGSPYIISATLDPASVLTNYAITYNTANFTITTKAASVTPNAATKEYGAADPALNGTLSGFLAGDSVTATYARTAGETVTGSPYTTSATLAPIGVLSNYAITYNTAEFTITAKAASVTPNAATKEYGAADPALSGTLSGFLAGDNVTATYARTAGETVAGGPYTISATLAPVGVLSNYAITYNTANFTISQKPATWTTNPASKMYGAADPVPLTTGSGTGFLPADGVTATYSRAAGQTVAGSPYHITATLSATGLLSNYLITNAGANFIINPKPLTITANSFSKVLGTTYTFLGTEFTKSALVAGDSVTSVTLASAGAAAGATVTAPGPNYAIVASSAVGTGLSNYAINYVNGTLTVVYATTGMCLGSPGHQVLQPLNIDGTSVVKKNSTVPVKFRVCDANGNSIGTPGVVASFQLLQVINGTVTSTVNEDPLSTTPDAEFRWSASDQQWIFNLNTKNLTANRTYVYQILLNDGSSIGFQFGTKP